MKKFDWRSDLCASNIQRNEQKKVEAARRREAARQRMLAKQRRRTRSDTDTSATA